ncbi:microfibril-associated 4-like glycoprotein, partial [Mytilus galloprovincialis]
MPARPFNLVFQHRMNGKINFYRDWESYKSGFGNMNEEHWLGNENLHQLTSQGKYMLRIDMSDFENNHRHAIYSQFSVGSERAGYRLDVTGYSGDAGAYQAKQNKTKSVAKSEKSIRSLMREIYNSIM